MITMIPWQHLVRWGGGSQDLQVRSGSIPEDSTWGGNLIFRHHRCNYRKHCASSSIHFHFQDKKPSPSSEAASSSPEASTAKKSNVWIPENIYIEFTIHCHHHQHHHLLTLASIVQQKDSPGWLERDWHRLHRPHRRLQRQDQSRPTVKHHLPGKR